MKPLGPGVYRTVKRTQRKKKLIAWHNQSCTGIVNDMQTMRVTQISRSDVLQKVKGHILSYNNNSTKYINLELRRNLKRDESSSQLCTQLNSCGNNALTKPARDSNS